MAENRYFSKKLKFYDKKKQRIFPQNKVHNMADRKDFSKLPKLSEDDKKEANLKRNEKRNKSKKLKQMMKKRLIIRNLSFKISEEQLKEIFSKYGEVIDVNIPLNKEGKKRGFAFVCYKNTKSQYAAIKEMNFKKIEGRPIAIDVAVPKSSYQYSIKQENPASEPENRTVETDSEEDSADEDAKPNIKVEPTSDSDDSDGEQDEESKKVKNFLKEFDADKEEDEQSDESSDEFSEDDEGEKDVKEEVESILSEDTPSMAEKTRKRKESNDVSEGKTIFIRNISFKNTEEDLQDFFEEYGEIEYCLLCLDSVTDHPKGTAFIKFKSKECADKVIEESYTEPGLILDGRKLLCAVAISRGDMSKIGQQPDKVKDKRNLRLLKCGLIMQGSPEAQGVSQADMAKRIQLETVKKQKLKNVNFFVSDKRLAIHNLPKNIIDKDLRIMFKKAGGKGATVKEARVMRDFKRTDEKGNPTSRGFGFVSFAEHEHALNAIQEFNNNPSIFTPHKRPIVEFSVENKVALHSQEKKRERMQMRNKKRAEEKLAQKNMPEETTTVQQTGQNMNHNNRGKKRKNKGTYDSVNKKRRQDIRNTQSSSEFKSKKKQKRNNSFNQSNISEENNQSLAKTNSNKQKKWRKKVKNSHNKESNQGMKDIHLPGSTVQANKSKRKQKKHKNRGKFDTKEQASLSLLTSKYKEKLQNKLS